MIPYPFLFFSFLKFVGLLVLVLIASLVLSLFIFCFPYGEPARRKKFAKRIFIFLSLPLVVILAYLAIESRLRMARILNEAEKRIPLDIVMGAPVDSAFQPPLPRESVNQAKTSAFLAWGGNLLSRSKIDLILRTGERKIELPRLNLLFLETNEDRVKCLDASFGAFHSLPEVSQIFLELIPQIDPKYSIPELSALWNSRVPNQIPGADSGTIRLPVFNWSEFVVRPYLRGYCPELAGRSPSGCRSGDARWSLDINISSFSQKVCLPYRSPSK